MAYVVHNFEQGDILYADQLNEMDAQIALNEENISSGVSSDMLAEDYSANKTYSVGDYAVYNNDLYVCISEITAPEGWNPAHWQVSNLGDGISDIKSYLGFVTPEMFGAKGDGQVDDTDAIRSAIEASDVICFKANTVYKVTAVQVPGMANKILYGNGATLKSCVTDENYQINGVLSNFIGLSGDETGFVNGSLEIYDLTIDGNADIFAETVTSNYLNGIALRNYSKVTIVNCCIKNTFNAGVKLIFCDNSFVENCHFEDICLMNYDRDWVGEGVISQGYFWKNGNTKIYNLISSFVVNGCTFKNIYDSPAVARYCKYQSITNCYMAQLHLRAFEVGMVFQNDDNGLNQTSIFENNTIDTISGSFVTVGGIIASGCSINCIVRDNVVKNIRGMSDVQPTQGDVSYSTIIVLNESGNVENTNISFINNYLEYAALPLFTPTFTNTILVGGVSKVSFCNNTFRNILNSSGNAFLYVQSGDTEIVFNDNDISGIYAPEQVIFGYMNRLTFLKNKMSFANDPIGTSVYKGCICLIKANQYTYDGMMEVSSNVILDHGWTRLMRIRNYPESLFIRDNYIPSGALVSTYFDTGAREHPDNLIAIGNIANSFGASSTDVTILINANNSFI